MRLWLFLLVASIAASGETRGLRPRVSATDYPAYAAQNGIQIASEALDPEHVRKSFATDLYQNYIVVEVAVFPGKQPLKLRDADFELRLNGTTTLRPVSPEAIASSLTRPARSGGSSGGGIGGRDVYVYPEATIGYERGTYPNGQRSSGVVYGGGVGVGVGAPGGRDPRDVPPRVADRNRGAIEAELTDKGLPSGEITQPVAGYLYFPMPSNKKRFVPTALEYLGDTATVNVLFPPPRKK